MNKGYSLLLIINIIALSLLVLSGVAAGAYYFGTKYSTPPGNMIPQEKSPQIPFSSQSVTPTSNVTQNKTPLFSGTLKLITKDLGLFKISDIDKENGVPDSIVYYEAGTFNSGALKGYTRVLAIRPPEGPGQSLQFMLATKDFTSYILNDPKNKTVTFPIDDWDNPYTYINKSKITSTTTFDTDHPKTITVEKPFILIKEESFLLVNENTGKKNSSGYEIYQETPVMSYNSASKLTSSQNVLSLYAGGTDWSNSQPQNEKDKTALATRIKYLHNTTLVQGVDSTGLTYSYVLTTQKESDSYLSVATSEEQKLIAYKKQVALYNEKKIPEYPAYPTFIPFPGMRLTKSSAGLGAEYYNSYDSAFPGGCGGTLSTYVVSSITDVDLDPVASKAEFPLFVLKDSKHPLYKLAYETKTDQGDESFKAVNNGKSIPTLDAYASKHPLLFFKDTWGRWAIMGEFDLMLMGGCGKPVVYLYPEKPTVVHLEFSTPMALNTQIPFYLNGWLVKAHPDGTLNDLQPQYTDCSKIDGSKIGSEYATNACKTNSYPYIYWSGKSVTNSYPKSEGGWIVEKENLLPFMQSKLSEIGLTQKESSDMISYWVPKMNEKNAPYYRLSFLQTKDMNAFIPMNVNPHPDSVLRVFLDWKALKSKPTVGIVPQKLTKFERNGFTLVEWGGLLE